VYGARAREADINVIKHGRTALDLASMHRQKEIPGLLRKHGGRTAKELEAEGK
jgi:hypothetical protein